MKNAKVALLMMASVIFTGAAFAADAVIGRRRGWPHEPMMPHDLTLMLLGAGLLWFGWFGFNAGSAAASGTVATAVIVAT